MTTVPARLMTTSLEASGAPGGLQLAASSQLPLSPTQIFRLDPLTTNTDWVVDDTVPDGSEMVTSTTPADASTR